MALSIIYMSLFDKWFVCFLRGVLLEGRGGCRVIHDVSFVTASPKIGFFLDFPNRGALNPL